MFLSVILSAICHPLSITPFCENYSFLACLLVKSLLPISIKVRIQYCQGVQDNRLPSTPWRNTLYTLAILSKEFTISTYRLLKQNPRSQGVEPGIFCSLAFEL